MSGAALQRESAREGVAAIGASGGMPLLLPTMLLVVLVVLWVALAIAPLDRETWMLENLLLLVYVCTLVASFRRFRFSSGAYVMMFVFLTLHTIGGHYTYSLVPYDDWVLDLTGETLNERLGFTRNHYDRLLHFLFGLLLAVPARELLIRVTGLRPGYGYAGSVVLLMACSTLYELIEWAAAVVFGGELGVNYLGTQGDEWDSQRDMGLATLGSILAMALAFLVNRRRLAT